MKRYEYPVITEDNFEKMIGRLLVTRRNWNSSWEHWDNYQALRVRSPRTRGEFFEMTNNMFGVGLTFTGHVGEYEVEQRKDWYSELPIPKLWDKRFGCYDGLKILLNTAFGDLTCGGVSGGSYAICPKRGHRARKRLEGLYSSVLPVRYKSSVKMRDE